MAPSKRRKTPAVSQPASENTSSGVRTRRSASARDDLPDAPEADLDAEPEEFMCPITRTMFRDPVMLFDSGHTYERSAILSHFERNGAKDPLTRRALSSTKVMTNWAMRNVVQAWLDKHPGVTPDGWDSRELLEPSKDDGTRTSDDEGDVGVLRTWRAMCPELQERWPEDEQPEDWLGVGMENGLVVELNLEDFGLTGAVPAEVGQLASLEALDLGHNKLTSVPAVIGQLRSLTELYLDRNQLTSLPAEIGQLTELKVLNLHANQLTSLPAQIWQLRLLEELDLRDNQLTSVPTAIHERRAAGCEVSLDAGVTTDEGDDVRVLRTWRAMCPELQERWPEDEQPDLYWEGVTMVNGRVVQLRLGEFGLTGAVPAEIGRLSALGVLDLNSNKLTSVPAEIGQLVSLRELYLHGKQLTRLPAEIWQLTSLERLYLGGSQLKSVPVEIGQLSLLQVLHLGDNKLTSVPAEIGQLASLRELYIYDNQLTSVPAEVGQLRSLERLDLQDNRLTSVPAEIGQLTALKELWLSGNRLTIAPAEIGQLRSLERLALKYNQLTSLPVEIGQLTLLKGLYISGNQLTSMAAEIGQLRLLEELDLGHNKLTRLPAENGQLTALTYLNLSGNQLTSVPAAIRELRAAGCNMFLDASVTFDE
jgi:leucine-rich repeat protein SHOC2